MIFHWVWDGKYDLILWTEYMRDNIIYNIHLSVKIRENVGNDYITLYICPIVRILSNTLYFNTEYKEKYFKK